MKTVTEHLREHALLHAGLQSIWTMQHLCEYICRWLKEKHGVIKTPEEIYYSSPTGELYQVFHLYWQAQVEMGEATCYCTNTEANPGDMCLVHQKYYTSCGWLTVDEIIELRRQGKSVMP
jgi:hypothetical protein